jgi:hypothetical protein
MSTTSSKNFTTLYSGAGSVVPQGAYGNANVVSLLAAGTDGGNTVSNIIATGNVTASYFIGNGSQLTGVVGTYSNAQVSAFLASGTNTGNIITAGNISGAYVLGNGSQLTGLPATYSNAQVSAYLASGTNTANIVTQANVVGAFLTTSGANGNIQGANYISGNAFIGNTVSVAGNVTASYYIGNGSLLTGIASSTYGNANVANFLGNGFGSNTITTTGNITAGNINTANYVAFGTTGAQTTAATGQMFWDATEQTVSLGMNNGVTQQIGLENYILVKASATISNGQVVMFTGAAGDNVQAAPADTTSVGFRPEYIIGVATQDIANNAFGYITTFGKVRGLNTLAYTVGDILWVSNSTPGALTATQPTDPNYQIEVAAVTKVSGGDGQILVRVTPFNGLGSLTDVTITTPSTGQSLVYSGNVWVNANISAANITAAGSNTQIQFNDLGVLGANANLAYDKATNTFSTGIITATGNINGANLVASANLTSTQQTIVGTGNITGGTGNIILSGKNIATDMAFNPDGGNATNAALSRINVGTGWLGNITHSTNQNRLVVQDTFNRTNTGTAVQLFASDPIVNLTGNVTTNSFRVQAIGGRVRIGGGSAANTIQLTGGAGVIGSIAALQPNIDVGNVSPYNLGNTTVSHATLNGGFITMYQGSLLGNAYGMIPGALATSTGNALAAGNITNYIGFASQLGAAPFTTGNVYAFYHANAAGSAQALATGIGTANAVRTAANYYAFRNDDLVAQVQLGSLRNYHEYQYSTATSGTVNIDKNNAQIQYIAPTANVTIGDFQNFVTTASNSVSNINQTDTVTLIIKQGATPYSVFMPTGNAAIKYASGNSTVGVTANAVTMISVSAANVAGAALYMVTVSPEFT